MLFVNPFKYCGYLSVCFWLPYSIVNNYTITAEHVAIIKTRDKLGLLLWRRGWDSNPRDPCEPDSFQDCSLQPLGHLSILICISQLDLDWRRGRDSNSRGELLPPTGLAIQPLQPLGYLSVSRTDSCNYISLLAICQAPQSC